MSQQSKPPTGSMNKITESFLSLLVMTIAFYIVVAALQSMLVPLIILLALALVLRVAWNWRPRRSDDW